MTNLCIITARGGSKRIPRKNIKLFAGPPIIAYPIHAALESRLFTNVVVSTDDTEIADIATRMGASVPFLRSAETSDDYATTVDVLREVLDRLREEGLVFEHVCCCYPTSPFLTANKLEFAYQILCESGADCVIPVCEYATPIHRALTINNDRLEFFWPEHQSTRSQDLPSAYFDTGQFYFFRTDRFQVTGALVSDNTIGIPVPRAECQDIDTEDDWMLAELKYELWKKNLENGSDEVN